MRTRVKLALTTVVVVAAVFLLSTFLDWANRSSDQWFWAGVLGSLSVFVIAPAIIAMIWRAGREWADRNGQGRTI